MWKLLPVPANPSEPPALCCPFSSALSSINGQRQSLFTPKAPLIKSKNSYRSGDHDKGTFFYKMFEKRKGGSLSMTHNLKDDYIHLSEGLQKVLLMKIGEHSVRKCINSKNALQHVNVP